MHVLILFCCSRNHYYLLIFNKLNCDWRLQHVAEGRAARRIYRNCVVVQKSNKIVRWKTTYPNWVNITSYSLRFYFHHLLFRFASHFSLKRPQSLSYSQLLQVCIIVVFVALLGSSTEDIAGMVKQVGASSKVKKVHYPSSKFEVDKVQVRSKGNGLREVLKEICSKEEESLKPIFSLEGVSAKDALNKKNIHDALLEMMSRLNDSVAQDLDEEQETYFKPELSKEEREQIELKQNKLESLQKQLDKLNHYSENLNDFREAAGLWLGTAPAVKVQIWKFL